MADTRVSEMLFDALHEVDPDASCHILQDAHKRALELEQEVATLRSQLDELHGLRRLDNACLLDLFEIRKKVETERDALKQRVEILEDKYEK